MSRSDKISWRVSLEDSIVSFCEEIDNVGELNKELENKAKKDQS